MVSDDGRGSRTVNKCKHSFLTSEKPSLDYDKDDTSIWDNVIGCQILFWIIFYSFWFENLIELSVKDYEKFRN